MKTFIHNKNYTLEEIEIWIMKKIAKHLKRETETIDKNAPLYSLGLDSLNIQSLCSDIESHFKIEMDKNYIPYEESTHDLAIIILNKTHQINVSANSTTRDV